MPTIGIVAGEASGVIRQPCNRPLWPVGDHYRDRLCIGTHNDGYGEVIPLTDEPGHGEERCLVIGWSPQRHRLLQELTSGEAAARRRSGCRIQTAIPRRHLRQPSINTRAPV